MKVKRESRRAVFASHAVFRLAGAINDLLSEEAVALHAVLIPLAPAHGVLSEAKHFDFRMKGFGVLNRAAKVCGFEVERYFFSVLALTSDCSDSITHLCKHGKRKLTPLCNQFDCDNVRL